MTVIERDIEKYISDVNSHLLCSSKKKKEIIEDIRGAVLDFAEDSGTENIEDIYKHFGTPEELAKAHLTELDPKQIKRKVNVRKVLIVAVVATLIVFAVAMIIIVIDNFSTTIDKIVVGEAVELLAMVHLTNCFNI